MNRETDFYTDGDFIKYEVEYVYSLGQLGNYFDPPEPNELEIIQVYDTENKIIVSDQELIDEIEEHFYNELNS